MNLVNTGSQIMETLTFKEFKQLVELSEDADKIADDKLNGTRLIYGDLFDSLDDDEILSYIRFVNPDNTHTLATG